MTEIPGQLIVQDVPESITLHRSPQEVILRFVVALASLMIWTLLVFSLIGAFYGLIIGVALLVSFLIFVAHVRGSGVRLGPDQLPDLYARVTELSRRAGMKTVPEVYILQSDGSRNALALRFLGTPLLVLFSDLLEACGDNQGARDMIVGHELGHHCAGHLKWRWLLMPGLAVPFLGAAYSRACEYTCDRFGMALSDDRQGALEGLAILAAGGKYASRVRLKQLVEQRENLNTGLMTLGKWLMSHPPLCDRVAALEPALAEGSASSSSRGAIRALAIVLAATAIPFLGMFALAASFFYSLNNLRADLEKRQVAARPAAVERRAQDPMIQIGRDFTDLAALARQFRDLKGNLPEDERALFHAWKSLRGNRTYPQDPYDGQPYGYDRKDDSFFLWSSGPDGQSGTDDDPIFTPGKTPRRRGSAH